VEIELRRCRYSARCSRSRCRAQATVFVRYLDVQGRPLRQVALCERHRGEITKGGIAVRDMR
jgi:hypothetical protein